MTSTTFAIETKDERFPHWRWAADRFGFLRAAAPRDNDPLQQWVICPASETPGGHVVLLRNVGTGSYARYGGADRELTLEAGHSRESEWSLDPSSDDWQLIVHAHEATQACDLYANERMIGTWPLHWEANQWWRLVVQHSETVLKEDQSGR